ncbi:sugar-binding transcriptional regulator [Jannaschia formosa]|uniref:sugar-binding transcriptional regulator n=1 Tax=Jannaschia formosa TaxID=2259592 RepID=UPI000E1BE0D9|nr:sugar-binding domain-containing protein [Jannaschia formosa]TFL16211.1 transcriptional regulator [Jannaschia formosa]
MLTGERRDDEIVQAAWLYYVGNLSQQQVSDRLGLSRFKVNRMLADARDLGVVRLSLEHRTSETLALADRLTDRFGLKEVQVAPVPAPTRDHDYERTAVGILAATYLARIGSGDRPLVIGVGWGRTLSAMADNLAGLVNGNLTFVSLTGSVTHASRTAPGDVCVRLASQTGGRAMLLPAPFVADSEQACATILEQRLVRETLSVARNATHVMMSVGECRDGAILFEAGLFSPEQLAELRDNNVVGDCCGVFFTADGAVADIPLNRCTPCVRPSEMGEMDVLVTAAGVTKAAATLAVLRARFVDRLLIDETLARAILDET